MRSGGHIPIRVARALYGRWRTLAPVERERLHPLAAVVKQRALDLPGSDDPAAEAGLAGATEELAEAIARSAEGDPEADEVEVQRLRDDLRRELDRLAEADERATRCAPSRPGGTPGSGS